MPAMTADGYFSFRSNDFRPVRPELGRAGFFFRGFFPVCPAPNEENSDANVNVCCSVSGLPPSSWRAL